VEVAKLLGIIFLGLHRLDGEQYGEAQKHARAQE
jgi:hypothetical protein